MWFQSMLVKSNSAWQVHPWYSPIKWMHSNVSCRFTYFIFQARRDIITTILYFNTKIHKIIFLLSIVYVIKTLKYLRFSFESFSKTNLIFTKIKKKFHPWEIQPNFFIGFFFFFINVSVRLSLHAPQLILWALKLTPM